MEKITFLIKSLLDHIVNLLLPTKCIGCNKRNEIICLECIKGIPEAERPTEKNIFSLYDYRNILIKKAIWKLKYYHSRYLGQKLGELLYESMVEEIQDIVMFSQGSPIYVIPIPISKDRKSGRGYNQSEMIARGFCRGTDASHLQLYCTDVVRLGVPRRTTSVQYLHLKTNILYKKSNTIAQAKLTNRNKRLKNIKGAFGIKNENLVKDKNIIIIDDVTTTGATITEAIKILKSAGAKKVVGFTVAH